MNTETKVSHTPGPWQRETWQYYGKNGDIVDPSLDKIMIHNGKMVIAQIYGDLEGDNPYTYDWVTCNANANLIAAAPELLEALEDAEFLLRKVAINWKEAGRITYSLGRSANDALEVINKAKGLKS